MQPADLPPPPPTVDAETARRTVADVLSRPEYADLEPTWWERVVSAFTEGVGRLLDALTGTTTGAAVGWLILLVLAGVVALLVVRALRGVRREGAAGLATDADVGRSPQDWSADAAAHEAAGRWREAVRCRYRALVAALADAGVVEEVPGRTAGEYLAAVRAGRAEAATAFARATRVFERAWYGRGDVGPEEAEAVAAAAEETLDRAGAGPRRAVGAAS